MTSLGPWFGGSGSGRRAGIDQIGSSYVDPFDFFIGNLGLWDSSRRRRQGGGGDDDTASVLAHTNVDWRETVSAHIFHAHLPGVKKEEVKVHVEDGNTLQISGEHTVEEVVDTNNKWHCSERRRGSFVRRFRLPENAKMDEIKCSMEHGVLTVVVPKIEEEEKPKNVRAIDIAISIGLHMVWCECVI